MPEVADALRRVTAAMQKELETGRRPNALDAEDLIDVLLTVADELDPFTPRPRYSGTTEA
jgi:chorismate mutase